MVEWLQTELFLAHYGLFTQSVSRTWTRIGMNGLYGFMENLSRCTWTGTGKNGYPAADPGFPRRRGNLLYGQISPKTGWKLRKLDLGARPKFYFVDPPLIPHFNILNVLKLFQAMCFNGISMAFRCPVLVQDTASVITPLRVSSMWWEIFGIHAFSKCLQVGTQFVLLVLFPALNRYFSKFDQVIRYFSAHLF